MAKAAHELIPELQATLERRASALAFALASEDPEVTRERELLEGLRLTLRLAGDLPSPDPLLAIDARAEREGLRGASGGLPLLTLAMDTVAYDEERPWWLTPAP